MSDYEITEDAKRDVLDATDLVALVGASTTLKKAGASWKGLCPFHTEKTPSFHVHPAKGFYYCFGCGAKGDAITFVRETERLEFPEAVAYLARRAGITLPERRRGTRVDRSRETRINEALTAAASFFREQLPKHAEASALLQRRGIDAADAAAFGFGAAPDAWDRLKTELSDAFTEEVLVESGVLQKNPETGRVYDRFRNRLTIEIRDARGELLGFGARALGDEQPKYLNSPETARFSKGKLLYGLDRARDGIRKSDAVILVEGYFDRIALEKAGVPNVVASMGTALTPAQADLLVRQAPAVVVAYDGDPAGLSAARKAFALLLERGANVKHLVLPGEHDPDSFRAERGDDALRQAVEGALPVVASLAATLPPAGSDPSSRADALNEAASILKSARDPVLKHELLAALARVAGVPLALLAGRSASGGKKTEASRVESVRGEDDRQLPEVEQRVVSLLLWHWPETAELIGRIPPEVFQHATLRELFMALQGIDRTAPTLDFSHLASHLEGGAGRVLARLLIQEPEDPGSDEEIEGRSEGQGEGRGKGLEKLHKLLMRLKLRQLEERKKRLTAETVAAQAEGDLEKQGGLLKAKGALLQEIERLKKGLV